MNIEWSDAALQDLEELKDYIAQYNPAAAARQVNRIYAASDKLERHPHIGRIGRSFGTRELVIGKSPYVVAYRVRHEVIEILRVIHGRRRWPAKI